MQKIDTLKKVSLLVADLESEGLSPVLVGGMALVLLGSQRVTRDFDFLVSMQSLPAEKLVELFYRHGFELVSKLNEQGEVLRTIDNPKVAGLRLKTDGPESVYFFNHQNRLKIDLLFDFPLPAREVAARAVKLKIKSDSWRVACREDLVRMKELAYADRQSANDAHDLEFLEKIPKGKV